MSFSVKRSRLIAPSAASYPFFEEKQCRLLFLFGAGPSVPLLGGTVWVPVVGLLFTGLQPTDSSRCLQPYGIV